MCIYILEIAEIDRTYFTKYARMSRATTDEYLIKLFEHAYSVNRLVRTSSKRSVTAKTTTPTSQKALSSILNDSEAKHMQSTIALYRERLRSIFCVDEATGGGANDNKPSYQIRSSLLKATTAGKLLSQMCKCCSMQVKSDNTQRSWLSIIGLFLGTLKNIITVLTGSSTTKTTGHTSSFKKHLKKGIVSELFLDEKLVLFLRSDKFDDLLKLVSKKRQRISGRIEEDEGQNKMPEKNSNNYVSTKEIQLAYNEHLELCKIVDSYRIRLQLPVLELKNSQNTNDSAAARLKKEYLRIFMRKSDILRIRTFRTTPSFSTLIIMSEEASGGGGGGRSSSSGENGKVACSTNKTKNKKQKTVKRDSNKVCIHMSINTTRAIAVRLVLLSFLSHLPPKRADLGNVRITNVDKNTGSPATCTNSNRIELVTPTKSRFILTHHKTSSTHQALHEVLPARVFYDIKLSTKLYDRHFLIVDSIGRPYTKNNSFSQYFKRTFADMFSGRAMGVTMMRHVFISEKVEQNKMNHFERKQVAKSMLHSQNMQSKYIWRNIPKKRINLKK